MKRTTAYVLMTLALPFAALAQEAATEYSFPLSARIQQFFMLHMGWPLVGLILATATTLLLLIRARKKRWRSGIPRLILLGFLTFVVWYFYPVFTYKGTYQWKIETTCIDHRYTLCGSDEESKDIEIAYQLKPFRRMLWVEFGAPELGMEYVPIQLGWNTIHQPTYMDGIVEMKKVD